MRRKSLAILYWGRRGGGQDLFNQLIRDSKVENLHVFASPRPMSRGSNGSFQHISILAVYHWIKARRNFKSQIRQQDIKVAILVMASPWDIKLGKSLMKSGVDVIRVIHDGKPHPGEYFPTKSWIKLLTKDCSRVFTLSAFVALQIQKLYGIDPDKITICEFPNPENYFQKARRKQPSTTKKVLLIGRGRKYQGQQLIERAWELCKHNDLELVIAGEGFKPNSADAGIKYKNWWMTREEMLEEIASSDLVVFPYLEASQSGTIPICRTLGIPVLVTPVGGLPEQVEHGITGLISDGTCPSSLASSIVDAMSITWKIRTLEGKSMSNGLIQSCLKVAK